MAVYRYLTSTINPTRFGGFFYGNAMHYSAPPPKADPMPVTHHERLGYWVESDMAIHLLQQYRLEVPAGYRFITPNHAN